MDISFSMGRKDFPCEMFPWNVTPWSTNSMVGLISLAFVHGKSLPPWDRTYSHGKKDDSHGIGGLSHGMSRMEYHGIHGVFGLGPHCPYLINRDAASNSGPNREPTCRRAAVQISGGRIWAVRPEPKPRRVTGAPGRTPPCPASSRVRRVACLAGGPPRAPRRATS